MEHELTFTFTQEEANTIVNALAQLPYHQSVGLISKISQQFVEQGQITEEPVHLEEVPEEDVA
jgi:hypothetical protein